jgi:hypothetical protein
MVIECRNLRFNLEKELDRKAKETLLAVPVGQRTQFILNAICAYGEQQTEIDRQEQFALRVAEIVLDALADVPVGAIGSKSAETVPDEETLKKNLEYAEDFLENWC